MKTFLKIFLLISLAVAACNTVTFAQNHPKGWQEAKSISGNFKAVSSQPQIEVFSTPNIIMIKINRESEVRLFTILGKLISSQFLKPGIYEYHLDSHGVYIIKTDDISCKIAI